MTLFGYRGEVAPKDLDGFRAWARSLAAPDLADLIEQAEPIGDGDTLRHPGSTWRRYDLLRRWPEGLLVLGDAFCSLNPSLGQGITVAAIQADALDESLGGDGDPRVGLARRFFQAASEGIMPAWQMSSGNDLRWSNGAPPPNVFQRALGWYMNRYRDAAAHDAELAKQWCAIVNQETGPQALLRPALVWRTLVRSEARDRLPSRREALAG